MNKKLIEVALPLEAINKASAREKSIRHGHPSTLHLWWARRPLAAARAVIFAQMVDDPASLPDLFPTEQEQQKERERLFRIIEELVRWENTTNKAVLDQARVEIWQSWRRACAENADHPRAKELFDRHTLPAFHDPFAGGGALPLEAQRLGLEAYASDLNPVAVLINKAMIEIPPRFAGRPPVNPEAQRDSGFLSREWKDARGLAEDVRLYGQWMRDEAQKRIGKLYPQVEVTADMVKDRPDLKPYLDKKLTVIAWLWARTVKSPNPAFADVKVPLASTFMLSTKPGKEAYVVPVIDDNGYRFTVKVGQPKDVEQLKRGTKLARGANFQCAMSGTVIDDKYIKAESMAGNMGSRLMAIVAEGERGRVYLEPTRQHEVAASQAMPKWKPDEPMNRDTRDLVSGRGYGFFIWADLFTPRQLVALTTFSDLVSEVMHQVRNEANKATLPDDHSPLRDGGTGAVAYGEAVGVYLALSLSKVANVGSSITSWMSDRGALRETFARQAIPMVWDYAESNLLANGGGSLLAALDKSAMVLEAIPSIKSASSEQSDAATQMLSVGKVVSTDPPYYNNIGYADLADFFYVWLRRSLRSVFPDLFATLAVPKAEELVATAYRHGSKQKAEAFFLGGMTRAMHRLAEQTHPDFPVTIYYAFKQSESHSDLGTISTGWETFLDAVIRAGFSVSGTWPMRTEGSGRITAKDTNALASSIILVCRRRFANTPVVTRREFITTLKAELPAALWRLQKGNIAPVDLAQAAIGPGMAIYTRYSSVVDAEGKVVPIREALTLINHVLDETLAEQEGDFDADSRFALAWFEQYGFTEGEFGVSDVLARAKNTSVDGLQEAGILDSKRGKVRLLNPGELSADWDPSHDARLSHWETVHQLIRVLNTHGESGAAAIVAKLGTKAETARELAYRLYTICERKKRASEALSYNALVQSFPEITRLAGDVETLRFEQAVLFNETEE